MKKGRILGMTMVLGVIVSLLASSAALAQDSSTPATAEAVVFDVGVDSDITSLNPFNLCCGPDYEVMNLMYDLAIGFDNSTLEAAPAIVESWEHSEDYMDWTMNVREGATFSDGTPLTAEDVAFTFGFITDNAMPFYKDYFPFSPTYEVVSPTQLIWHAQEPTFAPEIPRTRRSSPSTSGRSSTRPRTRRRRRRSSRTRTRSAPDRSRSRSTPTGSASTSPRVTTTGAGRLPASPT